MAARIRRCHLAADAPTRRFGRLEPRVLHDGRRSLQVVVETFVRLYEQGLIYRGKRLVNWDPKLQTAVADLEVETEEEDGRIWEIRYPAAVKAVSRSSLRRRGPKRCWATLQLR